MLRLNIPITSLLLLKHVMKTRWRPKKTGSGTHAILDDVIDLPDESVLTVGVEGEVVGKEGEHAGSRVVARQEEDDSLGDHQVLRQTYSRGQSC